MGKYWHVITTGIQNQMVYRVNFFISRGVQQSAWRQNFILWRKSYDGRDQLRRSRLQSGGMISYYLMVTIVDALCRERRRVTNRY